MHNGFDGDFIVELEIKAEDRLGYLSDLMMALTHSKVGYLTNLSAKAGKENTVNVNIKVKIDSIEKLKLLIRK